LRPVVMVQRRGHDASVITITTLRLVLRRWYEDDALPMSAINADPEVMRWIDDGTVYKNAADHGGHRGVGARVGPPRLRVVRARSPYHRGAGRVRQALGARGHAQSAECRSSRIGDKAARHVNAVDGDVPTILLKTACEISVAEIGTEGRREAAESLPTARSRSSVRKGVS
jgi:hypothetical protein